LKERRAEFGFAELRIPSAKASTASGGEELRLFCIGDIIILSATDETM
jgi:hypothetical protein